MRLEHDPQCRPAGGEADEVDLLRFPDRPPVKRLVAGLLAFLAGLVALRWWRRRR
jgi:hypothetical protein